MPMSSQLQSALAECSVSTLKPAAATPVRVTFQEDDSDSDSSDEDSEDESPVAARSLAALAAYPVPRIRSAMPRPAASTASALSVAAPAAFTGHESSTATSARVTFQKDDSDSSSSDSDSDDDLSSEDESPVSASRLAALAAYPGPRIVSAMPRLAVSTASAVRVPAPAASTEIDTSIATPAPAASIENDLSATTPADDLLSTMPPQEKRSIWTIIEWLVLGAILRDCLIRLASRDVPSNGVGFFVGTKLLALSNGIRRLVFTFFAHLIANLCNAVLWIAWSVEQVLQARQYLLYGHSDDAVSDIGSHWDLLCLGVATIILVRPTIKVFHSNVVQVIYKTAMKTARQFVTAAGILLRTLSPLAVLEPLCIKYFVTLVIWSPLSQVTLNLLPPQYQNGAAFLAGVALSTVLLLLLSSAFIEADHDREHKEDAAMADLAMLYNAALALFLIPWFWMMIGSSGMAAVARSYWQLVGFLTHLASVISAIALLQFVLNLGEDEDE